MTKQNPILPEKVAAWKAAITKRRLQDAAPKLLAALETILANGSMHDDGSFVVNEGNGIEEAYSAIAEAKGN
jgi:hypothetical protein